MAFAASRVSILPVYFAILFCEVEVGHLLRTGQFAHLTPGEAFAHRYELLTEWLVGTLVVGAALAAALGLVAYACARSLQRASPPVSRARPMDLLHRLRDPRRQHLWIRRS